MDLKMAKYISLSGPHPLPKAYIRIWKEEAFGFCLLALTLLVTLFLHQHFIYIYNVSEGIHTYIYIYIYGIYKLYRYSPINKVLSGLLYILVNFSLLPAFCDIATLLGYAVASDCSLGARFPGGQ